MKCLFICAANTHTHAHRDWCIQLFLGSSHVREVLTFVRVMLYVRPRQTPCLLSSSKNSGILFCRCLTIMYAMSISNDWLTRDSRPEDGEQLLHEGVLFLPPVPGGSHGRPPAECSLSAAPCYVPIPPSRPSTRSLRGEEKSRESCREEREDKSEARARVRGRLARRRPLWLRWQVIPAQPPTTKQTLSPCGVLSSRATRNFFVDGSLRLRNGLLRISALKFFTRMSFCLHCNSLTPCRNEVPIVLRQYPCLEHNRKCIRLLLSLVNSPERSHLPGTSGLSSANQCSPPFMKWMYVRAHIRKTTCYHDAKEKAMRRRFLVRMKLLPRCILLIMIACDRYVRCAVATFRLRFFFDSHFFALRFAVVSQCPKFDSQTAMQNRINYSLACLVDLPTSSCTVEDSVWNG